MEMDPVRMIRRKPLHVVGAAVLAGLMMSIAGKKISRAFFPGPRLISGMIDRKSVV